MVSFLLLVTPLPTAVRKKLIHVLSTSTLLGKLQLALRFTFVFILILFIDSVNRVYRVQVEVSLAAENRNMGNLVSTERSEIQARRFYSQRNMYLCGFTLFLSLILNRTYVLVLDLTKAEDTIKGLRKSSDDAIKKGIVADESDAEIKRLKAVVAQKESDIETLKKQSQGLSAEYYKISDKLNEKEGVVSSDKKKD